MVKVILQLYPMIPAATEAEREQLRPIGRNADRYQDALTGWHDIVRAADRMGVWGVSTIEHHFHSEGYEVGPNPGTLAAYWAAITENVHVGQLGYVMSAHDPIRVAEETAVIDHLAQGRSFVGFARGYQARWTDILGQHLGTRATLSPAGASEEVRRTLGEARMAANFADDKVNREIFEEQVDLVLRAWTEDSVEHRSSRREIPYPYEAGIEWPMKATAWLGAPGEVDDSGSVRRVSVVPSPYTKPHPPVFVASNSSLETIEYCADKGFIPTYFSGIGRASQFGQAYVDRGAGRGFNRKLGENQALVRWMQVGQTNAEAREHVNAYDAEIYRNFYAALTPMPLDPEKVVDSIINSGLWSVGTVDELREQFVSQWEALPAEYVVLIFHYAQQPKESVLHNLETFMTHIKPDLDRLTNY